MSKILIVEDEESIAELEKDYLELSGLRLRQRKMERRDWKESLLRNTIC